MTHLSLIILLLAGVDCNSLNNDFYAASADDRLRPSFLQCLQEKTNHSNSEKVYLGAAMTLMASEYLNPYQKLKSFNSGTDMIDEGIAKDPRNGELRFVRYLIQSYSPSFLNYNNQLSEDLEVINASLNKAPIDLDWKQNYRAFKAATNSK